MYTRIRHDDPCPVISCDSDCVILFTFTAQSANAAFFGRLPATPGGVDYQAYYDDQLNITWTADANINGLDTQDNQVAWADGLTINGIDGWRLPNVDRDGDGSRGSVAVCFRGTQAACMDNEYGHLFHYGAAATLGDGITSSNSGPFNNIQFSDYWSDTELPSPLGNTWVFNFAGGTQNPNTRSNIRPNYAWAVHPGDVSAIPVPAAVWLFGSGLLGLLGLARRQH